MSDIGNNIKAYRKEKGLTQEQLGELVGLSENTIRRYELGQRKPNIDILKRISDALEVPLVNLLDKDNKDREKQYEDIKEEIDINMKSDVNVISRLVILHKDDRDYLEYLKDVLDDFGAYVEIINKQENLAVVGKYSLSKEDYRFELETLDRHRRMIHNNIIRGIKNINRMCKEDNLPIFYDGSEGDRVEVAEFVFKCVEKNFRNRKL